MDCDIFISCLDSHSDGTHSLQRIYWWTSDTRFARFLQICSDEETNSSTSCGLRANHWEQIYILDCIPSITLLHAHRKGNHTLFILKQYKLNWSVNTFLCLAYSHSAVPQVPPSLPTRCNETLISKLCITFVINIQESLTLQCFISLYANNFERLPHLVWECNDVLAWQKESEHERERCVWRRVYMRIGECGCMPWWMFTSSVPGLHFRCILHRLFKCRGGMLTPFTAQPILLSHYINLKYTRILIALQVPMCRRVCVRACVCLSPPCPLNQFLFMSLYL